MCDVDPQSGNTFAKLRWVHHQVLLRVIGFRRQLCTDHATLSYAKALETTHCGSIETTIRERRLGSLFAGAVARQSKERLPSWVMFVAMADGENPRPCGQFKTWHRCIVEDIREFRATGGSTERPPLGVSS